jgi:hypothetical protein
MRVAWGGYSMNRQFDIPDILKKIKRKTTMSDYNIPSFPFRLCRQFQKIKLILTQNNFKTILK